MRVAIYSPYLDTLGGGELYMATLAELLSVENEVTFFWDDSKLKKKLQDRFGNNLKDVQFFQNIFNKNVAKKLIGLRNFDLGIYLSDGSIPMPLAKRNVLHFQVPFKFNGKTPTNKLKLLGYQAIICNSFFTKRFIDQTFGVKSEVLYPPVNISKFKPGPKKNLIVSIGRFYKKPHDKKQEKMIEAFRRLLKLDDSQFLKNFRLIFVGGLQDRDFLKKLKHSSKKLPIDYYPDLTFSKLSKLLSETLIYWHAAGFGEDLENNPQKAEHFGISVVEAMAAGSIPVVFKGGGLLEIVKDGHNGLLWSTLDELITKTKDLITNGNLQKKISENALIDCQKFSKEKFNQNFKDILKTIK